MLPRLSACARASPSVASAILAMSLQRVRARSHLRRRGLRRRRPSAARSGPSRRRRGCRRSRRPATRSPEARSNPDHVLS
eukprot:704554-Pleurochrysis_carterae.AAC.1